MLLPVVMVRCNLKKRDHVWLRLNTLKSTVNHAVTCYYVQVYPGEARPFLATTKHHKEYHHSCCYLLLWYRYNLEKQDHVWQQLNTIKSTIIHAATCCYGATNYIVWQELNTITSIIIHAVTCCYGTGITWRNETMSGTG